MIRSDRERKSNNKYISTIPNIDTFFNRFISVATAQWIIRYILLFTAFLGMTCILLSVHYTSTVNHPNIITPHVIDLHRLTWSKYSKKPFKIHNGNQTVNDNVQVKFGNQSFLKYRLTYTAAFNDSRVRHSKTQYPVTLDAPYLLSNPQLCKSVTNLSALVVVHTAPSHFERRDVMRKTWTNNSYFHHLGSVRILFLLGTVIDNATQIKIQDEFIKYGDLIQGNFVDAYRNLTHKGVMGYKWISENCMSAKMIVKVDDDVVVDTYKLLKEYVPKLSGRTRYILCNHIAPGTMLIIREKKNKWYVDSDLFRGYKFYPRYCSGFGVIMSTDIIPFIYRAAYLTPFFWVDDVYLYGMLPSKIKDIAYISLAGNFSLNFKKSLDCIDNTTQKCPFLISGGGKPEDVVQLWDAMGRAHERTLTIEHISANNTTGNGEIHNMGGEGESTTYSDTREIPQYANINIKKEGVEHALNDGGKAAVNETKVTKTKIISTHTLE
ncbi:hypothetical protein ACJMK2_011343 [Sinanodonta woodiana]|uniref:Hexosyltransferase n=1 Tax=Sinanodonta woodiana TaxID=1069815 RepID=A0ABD3V770_SINWO